MRPAPPAQTGPVTAPLIHPVLAAHAVVLARGRNEWQVGVDPGRALVLSGAGFDELLGLLDGHHPLEVIRVRALAAGVRSRELDQTLRALVRADMVCDRDVEATADRSPARVRLIGAGPIGQQLARLLVADGAARLHVFDDKPPEAASYPTAGVLGSRALALCAQLTQSQPVPVRPSARTPIAVSVNHWSKPEDTAVDLTVIAVEAPEVDRVLTDHLLRTDQPHLLVRGHELGVSVGPLVIPGRTSCVQCADLTRRDADQQWPTVLAQLTRVTQTPPPVLVGWAAAVASAQARAFLSGGLAETAGSTLELNRPDYAMQLRAWAVHPGCGCGWRTTTEWGA